MKLQRAKPALLWLWRLAVVALVNVLVYLMLAAGGPSSPIKRSSWQKARGAFNRYTYSTAGAGNRLFPDNKEAHHFYGGCHRPRSPGRRGTASRRRGPGGNTV